MSHQSRAAGSFIQLIGACADTAQIGKVQGNQFRCSACAFYLKSDEVVGLLLLRWSRPFGQFCGLDKLYPVVVMPPF
ncbi:hypothetical protein CFR71_15730 [Novacetimonas pomaceti]|uniref:Uncharacterized protein n=1 Tax=Novacetimonas pomaceti TaxID=2021998 RepID=A0A318Q8U3_9PROT|nr:hypothetical protein CFR71_15730 [Novacetimonas pomaceti]